MDDALAASVVRMWDRFTDQSVAHFNEQKTLLDLEEPSYRD